MIWLTADSHLCHDKLWKEGYRPEGFEQQIVAHIQKTVKPGDVLLHLGDVSLYPKGTEMIKDLLQSLPGKKWLLRGNHDGKSVGKYLEEGWDWCGDSMYLDYQGTDLWFSHRPEPVDSGYNIHGHLHSNCHREDERINDGRHILISQEFLDYRPISLDHVVKLGGTPEYHEGKFRKRAL